MEKYICGIKFQEMPNTVWTEDQKLTIMETDSEKQTFFFETVRMKPYGQLFYEFNCVSLSMSAGLELEDATVDLDDIENHRTIQILQLRNDIVPLQFTYVKGKVYFPNIRSLWILGECPSDFPDLAENVKLDHLTVRYNKNFILNFGSLRQVKELVIYDYNEVDLTGLRNLVGLKRLEIVSGGMKNLNGLECLTKLETLIVNDAPRLINVGALLAWTSIVNIKFRNVRKISDFSFLQEKKNLRCLSFSAAESASFISKLPMLEFFFCKRVKDRDNKRIYFESGPERKKMSLEGEVVSYDMIHNVFLVPLS